MVGFVEFGPGDGRTDRIEKALRAVIEQGLSAADAARLVGVHVRTVRKWLARYRAEAERAEAPPEPLTRGEQIATLQRALAASVRRVESMARSVPVAREVVTLIAAAQALEAWSRAEEAAAAGLDSADRDGRMSSAVLASLEQLVKLGPAAVEAAEDIEEDGDAP